MIETDEDDQPDRRAVVVVAVPAATAPHAGVEAEAGQHRGQHCEEAGHGHDQHVAVRHVRELVSEHALDLLRLEALPQAGRDADRGVLGRATGGECVRHRRVHDRDLRLRQVRHRAQPLDHVVQRGRLLAGDDLRAGGGERELVRREVLEEREPDDDQEHGRETDVQHLEEDHREDHVEQAEEARREDHPQCQTGIATVGLPLHDEDCRDGAGRVARCLTRGQRAPGLYRLRARAPLRPACDHPRRRRRLLDLEAGREDRVAVADEDHRARSPKVRPSSRSRLSTRTAIRRPGRPSSRAQAAPAATRSPTRTPPEPSGRTSTS